MSGEERQRELREQGSRPAEAKKQADAQRDREALESAGTERPRDQPRSPDEPSPLPEGDDGPPLPRR